MTEREMPGWCKKRMIERTVNEIIKHMRLLQNLLNDFYKDDIETGKLLTREIVAKREREIFAIRLRSVRKDVGLTQREVAEKAGIHITLVTRYETARSLPRRKHIEKLASALNVPAEALDIRKVYPK